MPIGKYDRLPALRAKYIGSRFGRLVVISIDESKSKPGLLHLVCRCDCGNKKSVRSCNLTSGAARSCGCINRELLQKRATHGKAHSPEWSVWRNMIQRCTKPNNRQYAAYGGRGIKVCDEWLKFANFYRDMGDRPSPDHQIDRIDNNNGYSKDNCRWVTRSENMLNRRVFVTSSTGITGVRPKGNGFYAELKVENKMVLSKYFSRFEDAVEARKAAERIYIRQDTPT